MKEYLIKVDARKRISLGRLTKKLALMYRAYEQDGKIILEPVNIPKRERWLFDPKNREILKKIQRALKQKATISWDDIKKRYES